MNLRTTPLLFGLLLGILWLFGLMLVYKKAPTDENLIVPSMAGPDVKIDAVTIQFAEGKEGGAKEPLVFTKENDLWYLQQQGQKVRVEGFKIDGIVRQVQDAKRYEEERPSDDLKGYGLLPPLMTVTLKGKVKERDKEWTFNIGKEGAAKYTVYVNSSDRPGRAFPVLRSGLDNLFFKDVNALRSKRLFDFVEPNVATIDVKEGKEELALKKAENSWRYEKPALGFADFEATTTPGEDLKKKEQTGGVKGLISAIANIHVDDEKDFEPLGTDLGKLGLEEGKESLRIAVGTVAEKSFKKDEDKDKEKKDVTKEVLLVGKRAAQPAGKKGKEQYYARLLSDQGAFRVDAAMLDPIKQAVEDPTRIRSRDVVVYDPKKVDAVIIDVKKAGKDDKAKDKATKEEIKLLHPEEKDWQVVATGDKTRKGGEKAIQALLEALQGKKEIQSFSDAGDDSWGGLNGPNTTDVSVYLQGLEKPKKDAKKDEKKEEKKDAKEKKEEKEPEPTLKGTKPFVKLVIGAIDKEKKIAHVKRVLQDGTESRFTVPLAYVEKLHLDQGSLAFIDPALPTQSLAEVAAIDLQRGKDKVELDRTGSGRWALKDVHDPLGGKFADPIKVSELARKLTSLQARKWVKKGEAEKYGLKNPEVVVTLYTKSAERLTANGAASLVGFAVSRTTAPMLPALATMAANRLADRGDAVTVKFGKEVEEDKEKFVYAEHSGSDLPFLVPADLVKSIREADLRDRSEVAQTQGKVDATLLGLAAAPCDAILLASPLVSGAVHHFDPAKVKEVAVTLRTKYELRSFAFQRVGKDKTWVDQSGVKEFLLDADKVTQLLEAVCKLKTDRFASFAGPTGDRKLTAKEATLKLELTFDDGNTVTLTVGALFGQLGYFAHSSYWPEAVFFLPSATVEPWLLGPSYFGKERVAGI